MRTKTKRIYAKHTNVRRREWIASREYISPTLDVGAADGWMTAVIPGEVMALDITEPEEFVADCPFVIGSAYALPFDDASFGTVCSFETLEHLEEPEKALMEMRRVCTDRLYISVPSHGVMTHLNGHVQDFEDIRPMIEAAGFSVTSYDDTPPFALVEAVTV